MNSNQDNRPWNRNLSSEQSPQPMPSGIFGAPAQLQLSAAAIRELLNDRWREGAETTIANIDSVVEAVSDKLLSLADGRTFQQNLERIIPVLMSGLQDGPYEDELRRLNGALRVFAETLNSRPNEPKRKTEPWSLSELIEWWNHVDYARYICERHCRAWRQHLDGLLIEQRQRAIVCIEEIEKRIPLLRSHLLSRQRELGEVIVKCMILNAKLVAYTSDPSLRLFSNEILGPPTGESDASTKVATLAQAVIGNDLSGRNDWLQEANSLDWVQSEAMRLASQFVNDGRLDSNGKLIQERAYVDPLVDDTGEFRAAGTVDKAAFETASYPNISVSIKDLDGTLKKAGLGARQRSALLMRASGKIMSRTDVNEWKRGQRAIKSGRSQLIKAITDATKKRVIKAPLISGGSYSGVIREGATFTRLVPDEDVAAPSSSSPTGEKWFRSAPPPIPRINRKRKHLFK